MPFWAALASICASLVVIAGALAASSNCNMLQGAATVTSTIYYEVEKY